ncbi:MAG: DUF420 domain-containing protein [Saprospiraceae bacterium]
MNTPNPKLGKKLDKLAYVLSAVVIALVILMRGPNKPEVGFDTSILPPINAILNTFCALSLLMAVFFIKRKNVNMHRKMVFAAMVFSILFLLCYVLYHFTTYETIYCKQGNIRYVYFTILISHIILAAVSLPFILLTFIRGYTFQVEKHRRMAKWVFPIWLYVAISGPLVYLMLAPCYPK